MKAESEFGMQNPGHTVPGDGVSLEPFPRVRLVSTGDRSLVGVGNRVRVGPNEFIEYMYKPFEAEEDGAEKVGLGSG